VIFLFVRGSEDHLLNIPYPNKEANKANTAKKKPLNKNANLKSYMNVATIVRNPDPPANIYSPTNTSHNTHLSIVTISLTGLDVNYELDYTQDSTQEASSLNFSSTALYPILD
jgi:hypothetical protein